MGKSEKSDQVSEGSKCEKGVIYRTGEQVSKNARPKGNTPSHL